MTLRPAIKFGKRAGQIIPFVALSLLAMFGLLGLAIDFGWAFYVEKTAQSAADAAALAAVKRAMDNATNLGSFACGGGIVGCYADPMPCPSDGGLDLNLSSACLYAARNGFSTSDTNISVTVQASDAATAPTVQGCNPLANHPPTAPCVDTYYWVTVRVAQRVPQLFSAVLGNLNGTVSARATAAVARSEVIGSLILLNRENDPSPNPGVNLSLEGGPRVNVPGGIQLASNSNEAGYIEGNGRVISPYTFIRTGGSVRLQGAQATWEAPPENRPDGAMFWDPMRTKGGNPPLNPNQHNLPYIPVPNGVINNTFIGANCPGGICPPGNYYATTVSGGQTVATGGRITVANQVNVTFSAGADAYSGFGDFVFFGGMFVDRSQVNMGPGRYVMAGTNSTSVNLFEMSNNAQLLGGTAENSDAGRVLILTDSSYGNQLNDTVSGIPNRTWSSLGFSKSFFLSGNNANSRVEVYGLNSNTDAVRNAGLGEFGPLAIWQDQRNSNVAYDSSGQIPLTCNGGPCYTDRGNTPELHIQATPFMKIGGIIYQPRGAWTHFHASGDYVGALRIITGGFFLHGTVRLTLSSPSIPLTTFTSALVE